MKSVLRRRVRSNFTTLPNAALRDEQLSFRAVGVLAHMLSLRDGDPVGAERLAETHREGRDAVAKALQELTEGGYYRATRHQDGLGRFFMLVEVADRRGALLEADELGGDGALDRTVTGPGFSGPGDGPAPDTENQAPVDRGPEDRASEDQGSRSSRTDPSNNPPNPPDELTLALVEVCDLDLEQATAAEQRRLRKAVAQLRHVHATPAEIRTRAATYARRWPARNASPKAIASNWSALGSTDTPDLPRPAPGPARPGSPRDRAYRQGAALALSGLEDGETLDDHVPPEPELSAAFRAGYGDTLERATS